MNINDYSSPIEEGINSAFLSYLKQRLPDRVFNINGEGEITVNALDMGLQRQEQSLSGANIVSGHWRTSKGGERTWVQQHARTQKGPTAMELAEIEAQEEESPTVGFSIEELFNDFVRTLSNPSSLQNYLN